MLERLQHEPGTPLRYALGGLDLNAGLGRTLKIRFTGERFCIHCGKPVGRLYDGHCYPCFSALARCDRCIVAPHTCHHHLGTCREPAWGREHCLVPHVVYLAETSGTKVGVTGAARTARRWADQGATAALVLARTPDRRTAGQIEVAVARAIPDRTDWRSLIRGTTRPVDFAREHERAAALVPPALRPCLVNQPEIHRLSYPVRSHPPRARSVRLDRVARLEGRLEGILGQYLFVGGAALNVRRHAGFRVELDLA